MQGFLGLDGGGSTLRAVCVDIEGNVTFRGQGGPFNWASGEQETWHRSLTEATSGLATPTFVFASIAGILTLEDRSQSAAMLSEFFGAPSKVEPDYWAAVAAAPVDLDAVIIAGTGSVVASRLGDGSIVKSGGGGYLFGDEGSAFRYGSLYLTHLRETAPTQFEQIAPPIYRSPSKIQEVAALAAKFTVDLENGEPYALKDLETETSALVKTSYGHLLKTRGTLSEYSVGLTGGLWNHSERFAAQVVLAFEREFPNCRVKIQLLDLDHGLGAAKLALAFKEVPRT